MKIVVAVGWTTAAMLAQSQWCDTVVTKKVDMRETIIPEWDEVAAGVAKLAVTTVTKYWHKLETEDVEHFSVDLQAKSKRSKAKKAIEEYYDAANACLTSNFPVAPVKKTAYASLMVKIRKCIRKDGKMPRFVASDNHGATAKPGITLAPIVEDIVEDMTPDTTGDDGAEDDEPAGEPSVPLTQPPAPILTPAHVPAPSTTKPTSSPSPTPIHLPTPLPDIPIYVPAAKSPSSNPTIAPATEAPSPTTASEIAPPPPLVTSAPSDNSVASPSSFEPLQSTSPAISSESPGTISYNEPSTSPTSGPSPSTESPSSSAAPYTLEPPYSNPMTASNSDSNPLPGDSVGADSAAAPASMSTESPAAATNPPSADAPSSEAPTTSPTVSPSGDNSEPLSTPSTVPEPETDSPALPGVSADVPTPAPMGLPALNPQQQSFMRPALNSIPPLSVLDTDQSRSTSMEEWEAYVKNLKVAAMNLVAVIKDPVGKARLAEIVTFHYENINSCVHKNVAENPDVEFGYLVEVIGAHCYVKFRYSLFAGPPPFEFITRKATTVSLLQVEQWFSKNLAIARADLTGKRAIEVSQDAEQHLEKAVRCVYSELQTAISHDF